MQLGGASAQLTQCSTAGRCSAQLQQLERRPAAHLPLPLLPPGCCQLQRCSTRLQCAGAGAMPTVCCAAACPGCRVQGGHATSCGKLRWAGHAYARPLGLRLRDSQALDEVLTVVCERPQSQVESIAGLHSALRSRS
jgi:hypothetical protein